MRYARVGSVIRAIRRDRNLRQIDLASAGDRLLDRAHAALVDLAAKQLAGGWQTAIELAFDHCRQLLAPNARNSPFGHERCLFLHQMHVSDWRRVCP
jgi:hypothetical protein